jgi:murein DD-endopeptidase MepM/ murein hydrolase activator NlpD
VPFSFDTTIQKGKQLEKVFSSISSSERQGIEYILVDFEGVGDNFPVGTIYGKVNITFGSSWLGIISIDVGGSGNFTNEPSPVTAAYFLDQNDISIKFNKGVQLVDFYYSAAKVSLPITVSAYDKVGNLIDRASGNTIGSKADGAQCSGTSVANYCLWDRIYLASTTNNIHSVEILGAASNYFGIDNFRVATQNIFWLTFPLPGYTHLTAPVAAVMDNSVLERTPIEFYVPGEVIKAFNGETGAKQYGMIYLDPYQMYWPAYKNSTGTDFFPPNAAGARPLNYLNGPYLSYAGNAGYNYQVPPGTPVLATADGKLYKAVTDPVNGAGYSYYNNSYIDHQNGYYSWYLYAPLSAAILAEISQNGYARVTRGQVIGQTTGDHLHFEVRLNGFNHANVVDPYKLGLWLVPRTKKLGPWLYLLLQ